MDNEYGENLTNDENLLALAKQAVPIMEEVLGPSSKTVTAKWDCEPYDATRKVVTLRLSDFTGSANDRFAPDELRSQGQLRIRFYRLWGDLLQDRSHKQLEALNASDAGPGVG